MEFSTLTLMINVYPYTIQKLRQHVILLKLRYIEIKPNRVNDANGVKLM